MKTIAELGIKRTDAFNDASYWNNNGAYQKEGDELYAKLVPESGAAETVHGELIRGINRLFYEYCNNGNCNAIEVVTPQDHPDDFYDMDEDDIDWYEVEEVNIAPYYGKFIDLIQSTLVDTICPAEVEELCSDVREVIERGAMNQPCSVYFSRKNVNKYNLMCDAVIWYVLNTEDKTLPKNYKRA